MFRLVLNNLRHICRFQILKCLWHLFDASLKIDVEILFFVFFGEFFFFKNP